MQSRDDPAARAPNGAPFDTSGWKPVRFNAMVAPDQPRGTVPVIPTPSGERPLVLLFYDGFEWRAREGFVRGLFERGRQFARWAYRTLRRRQVHTGFYTAFLGFVAALREAGCDVRINDFRTARALPHHPIGLAGYPQVLETVALPNPVVFGPGDFGLPEPSRALADEARIRFLIQPSTWFAEYYRPFVGDKIATCFAPIDTRRWPDLSGQPKDIDVLIYDKIRWHRERLVPAVRERLCAHLDARGLSWAVVEYGHHHLAEFAAAMRRSRAMAFLCEHETQGLACEEALASGLPVFAWDEGVFIDPALAPFMPETLRTSTVPYFDDRCGRTFTLPGLEPEFDRFWQDLPGYRPRDYVLEALTPARCAETYLALYRAATVPPVAPGAAPA